MPGPMPKPAAARARRNKASTARTLSVLPSPALGLPDLPTPKGEDAWHAQTLAWWKRLAASPMAPEYDDSDLDGLLILAVLVDDFWKSEDPDERKSLAAEIRLQRQCFGTSPIDRRRLQWEIARGEAAAEETAGRAKSRKPADAGEKKKPDPRRSLAI